MSESCPFWEICVTPNWYPKSHKDFIDKVCMENWKACIRIFSGDFNSMETGKPIVKGSEEWNRIKKYIQEKIPFAPG